MVELLLVAGQLKERNSMRFRPEFAVTGDTTSAWARDGTTTRLQRATRGTVEIG